MKCISIRQPWAHLIVIGEKDYENRTWGTKYRGPLLIHAGKAWADESFAQRLPNGRPGRYVERDDMQIVGADECVARGAIIGQVTLVGCGVGEEAGPNSVWAAPYCVNWYLQDAVQFECPVPYKGQLGLFDVTLEDVERLSADGHNVSELRAAQEETQCRQNAKSRRSSSAST